MKLNVLVILSITILLVGAVFFILARQIQPKNTQLAVISSVQQEPNKSEQKMFRWGAYAGQNIADKLDFEEKIGSKVDMVATFVMWGGENYFPMELATDVKNNNQTLVVYWESRDQISRNLNDKKYGYDAILNGEWDDYILGFGRSIADSGTQVILIPFIEMNGNWYPWSITKNGNSPEKHKLAFRKIHDMLGNIANLELGWVVNNGSAPDTVENSIANLFPGPQYVDYVGVDGFNFGSPWEDFDQVFNRSLSELNKLDKPIMIFSTASAEGTEKPSWIDNFGKQLLAHREIVGFIWFNQDKERDWRVWSDDKSLEAFKKLIYPYSGI